MLRLLMLALALAALSPGAWAQNNPTLTEAERGIRRDDGPAVHLRIDALDVRAHLVGRTADVTVEMLIASKDADAYEANLALTLPADAVVTGYALDVGGRKSGTEVLKFFGTVALRRTVCAQKGAKLRRKSTASGDFSQTWDWVAVESVEGGRVYSRNQEISARHLRQVRTTEAARHVDARMPAIDPKRTFAPGPRSTRCGPSDAYGQRKHLTKASAGLVSSVAQPERELTATREKSAIADSLASSKDSSRGKH